MLLLLINELSVQSLQRYLWPKQIRKVKRYVLILHLIHHGRVGHPVVDDSINCDGDRVSGQDFLGRDIKSNCSKIYFLVMVNAG